MRRLAPAAVALAVLALAGCSAIPVAGPVNTAAPQGASQQNAPVLTPAKPTPGAARADIVRGFLYAASGQQDDYAIARDYLTPTFAKQWDPSTEVLVSGGAVNVPTQDGSTAVVPVAATVDSDGAYSAATSAETRTLSFSLVQVNGEWRISAAPNGIVLPSGLFARLFRALPLDYYTPGFDGLVPDLRWFPAGDGDSPQQVVRRLLAGAVGPVASPVTATAFPSGTRLRSVTVFGTAATVDLRFPSTPSATQLEQARRQLEGTLTGLGIDHVDLEVGGVAQVVRDWALAPTSGTDAPLVLQGQKFGYLDGSNVAADTLLGTAVVKAKPNAVTASRGQGRAAVRTTAGAVVLVTPTRTTVLDGSSAGLLAPTLDPDGWVWSVPASDPSGLRAYKDGKSVSVPIELEAETVTSIEMSRDGTRLLVVLDGATDPRVVVAGVTRGADGTPTGLTQDLDEAPVLDREVLDATWADSGSIAVLTKRSDGNDGVVLEQLGGLSSSDGKLSGATEIVGGPTQSDLVVLAGDLQQTSDGNLVWQSIASDIDLVAVQR